MRTVWKVPIEMNGHLQKVALPKDPVFLMFNVQADKWFAWFEVMTERENAGYDFQVIGTGHEVPTDMHHLSSLVQGAYVWHLYQNHEGRDL